MAELAPGGLRHSGQAEAGRFDGLGQAVESGPEISGRRDGWRHLVIVARRGGSPNLSHPLGTFDLVKVEITGSTTYISGLEIEDSFLARTLADLPEGERGAMVRRIIEIGVRGLATMGTGVALSEVDETVRRSVEAATTRTEKMVVGLLERAAAEMAKTFDPEQRSSLVARSIADLGAWRDEFLGSVDPAIAGSHTSMLLERLDGLLGPRGLLEERLTAALDPHSDESGFARLLDLVDRRFAEVRELMAETRGRQEEASRGTMKGFDYEDLLEDRLREACRPLGVIVERTSRDAGAVGTDALVGDFVLAFPNGGRVVVEAKNTRAIGLTGKDGILGELERAMANRQAEMAICFSATDAFPQEVGTFGVYGNRILAVEDGIDGTMVGLAIRWAAASLESASAKAFEPDAAVIVEKLQRLRHLAQLFTSNKRALTDINGSVDKVKTSLDSMRSDLLALVEEITLELGRGAEATVVPIRSA